MANQILIKVNEKGEREMNIKLEKTVDAFDFRRVLELVRNSCIDFEEGTYTFSYNLKNSDLNIDSYTGAY
jgi:hypothetical protein